jgi:hypothetical protein
MTRSRRQRDELDYLRRLAAHVPNALARIKLDLLASAEEEGPQMLFEAAALARAHLPDASEIRAGEVAMAALQELYDASLIRFCRATTKGDEQPLWHDEALAAIQDDGWRVLPAHADWAVTFQITDRGRERLAAEWPLTDDVA